MLTNIDIDEDLIAQAMKVSGARTKREAVDRALRELVARAQRPRFRDFHGMGGIDPAYDPKASSPEEFGRYRVEQPRASYRLAPSAPPASTAGAPPPAPLDGPAQAPAPAAPQADAKPSSKRKS